MFSWSWQHVTKRNLTGCGSDGIAIPDLEFDDPLGHKE
jgi:hypothetical protein